MDGTYFWLVFEVILDKHDAALAENFVKRRRVVEVTLKHFLHSHRS